MKKAFILVNAYITLPSQIKQAERICEELKGLGVETDVVRNDAFLSYVDGEKIACNFAKTYDFCVYLDKDKYMSQMLEKAGLRLFNRHDAVQVCDDKMQTYIALSNHGIVMPKTLAGLLCYQPNEKVKTETLDRIEGLLSYPIVVKESFGSLGKGVYLAHNREELLAIAENLKCRPHLFQETIEESLGQDVRVLVIGGKVLCAMKRQSKVDFRSNVELGGIPSKYTLDADMVALCERVASILQLDYCGIDVLLGKDKYVICEVNSNAFFGGLEQVTGVNVAKAYAKYMVEQIEKENA